MRLHIVGLPWTETTSEFATCAYTQKVVKAGKMFVDEGHEVFLYSGEQNETVCTEHVPLFTVEERHEWFGVHDQNTTWGHITWDPRTRPWQLLTARATAAILERSEPQDLLLLVAGIAQQPLANALPHLLACEPFVGYKAILTDRCAFESHAWRHHIYGLNYIEVGRNFDTVIPNYFDPDQFVFERDKQDHLLFVGRLIANKGPHVAAEIAKATGRHLLVAGPGAREWKDGRIVGDGVVIEGPVEYVGVLNPEHRAIHMANAYALVAPTQYIEPFGGVAVEAMMCGTPVIASNYGAFTETVEEGIDGWRFSTLAEGVRSVELCEDLEPRLIRERALDRFSLDAVGPQFTHWFETLDTLWHEGWYHLPTREAVPA